MANELVKSAFSSPECFESAQRMAKLLQESDLVPAQFKGSLPNCVIALEMSQRLGMNPLAIMQNIYIAHGKPAWSSQFLIACVNGCGKFSPLRYEFSGEVGQDSRTCIAWAYDLANNERCDGPPVSIGIAKKEGWYGKNGSKWQTMPELMLRYRAATFFARTYCPELTMGMQTAEEIKDVGEAVVVDSETLMPRRSTTEQATSVLTNAQVATEAAKRKRGRPKKEEEAKESAVDDVCEEYATLEQINKTSPAFVHRACTEVFADENATFADVDGSDAEQCGRIIEVAERLRNSAKG